MSNVVFEISRSYTSGDQIKSGIVTFGPRSLGDSGIDILAAKAALGMAALMTSEPTTPSGFETGLWLDCSDQSPMSIADGVKFDKKMEMVLIDFQFENRTQIIDYLGENMVITEAMQDMGSIGDTLLNTELGTLGAATLSILHGWTSTRNVLTNSGFISAEEQLSSAELQLPYSSLAASVSAALTAMPPDESPADTDVSTNKDTILRAYEPDHLSNPGPWSVDVNTLGYFYNTLYAYDSPPVFSNEDEKVLAIEDILRSGLLSFLKSKISRFIVVYNTFAHGL